MDFSLIFGNIGLLVEELVVFRQLVNLHVNVTVGRLLTPLHSTVFHQWALYGGAIWLRPPVRTGN